MKYTPHPDGQESTAFKIRRLFEVGRLKPEKKKELDKILSDFSNCTNESKNKLIESLKKEVEKYRKVKELLK